MSEHEGGEAKRIGAPWQPTDLNGLQVLAARAARARAPRARPLKLIVQIPCYNEAETLPSVVRDIPRRIDGVGAVELLVIDDGSEDGTADLARSLGVEHVISQRSNAGLARSFQLGIETALAAGADLIVNTDGDNQYDGGSIPALIAPILEGRADVVVGNRRPWDNPDFPRSKRVLQRVGSAVVRRLSGVAVDDAVSGFRAYSRDAALTINVMTSFSYTTETLVSVGQQGLTVASVPVRTNTVTRPSRLFKSTGAFLRKQVLTILRSVMMYAPLNGFSALGGAMLAVGAVPLLRFVYFFATGDGSGHIQSLVLGSMFAVMGYLTLVIALLGDTIATNRRLLETTLRKVRELELALGDAEGSAPLAPREEHREDRRDRAV